VYVCMNIDSNNITLLYHVIHINITAKIMTVSGRTKTTQFLAVSAAHQLSEMVCRRICKIAKTDY